jgi:hypothetical protein
MDSADVQVTLKTAFHLTPVINTERNGFLLKECSSELHLRASSNIKT